MVVTGRAVALLGLGALPVILRPEVATVLAWVVLVVLIWVLDVALAASPHRLTVARTVPASVRLEEPTTSTVVLTNVSGRRARGRLRDAWPPSAGAAAPVHEFDVRAGEGARMRTTLVPQRRGDRTAAGVTVRTYGPLRVGGRQVTLDVPATLRVLPPFRSRRHLPSRLARLREMDGRSAVQVRGEGTEFDSLREYVIGDDVRSIDWRATARRGDVVVRTWRPERDRRVLIVLDTSRTSAARIGDEPRLDAGIEASLLLSALASRAGDRVELLAFDRRARARVAGASGARLMPALAEALAPVEPQLVETDWPALVTAVRERLSQRALVVLLTTTDPAAVEAGLLPVVDGLVRDHLVVVASVRDPEIDELRRTRSDVEGLYDAAAAERGELERTSVATVLRRRGVEVLHAPPDELAPALADLYLALKSAGRL
ncbi:DUF58 domain-containing protein [Flavimobilis sp. GY10621]|uniref:DUF58 domain-containing protein n=1 Tax=Flavimobilis rhizosphaerae TaxID=2775421 RepID=A0ABR9DPA9_9MICO|nr:DUF58 domain-containing protein [Flavimobilis rhizosphaerae]MBD9698957.1 DUF58 domain-containing protein [Flavimobilis rhizosphaerae]